MDMDEGTECSFCGGDQKAHRADCPGITNLFPARPGLRCDRCGEPVGDTYCLDFVGPDAYQRCMEVLFADRDPAEAIRVCTGCLAQATLLDDERWPDAG
jgi:hypothetical protein